MSYRAVIDTNVLVSALLTHNPQSPTVSVVRAIADGTIVPVYSGYLISEYEEVLGRSGFALPADIRDRLIGSIADRGIRFEPEDEPVDMPDEDDRPIFLIAMQTRDLDTYLVTGNGRHFPPVDYVVTPRQMVDMLVSGDRARSDRSLFSDGDAPHPLSVFGIP